MYHFQQRGDAEQGTWSRNVNVRSRPVFDAPSDVVEHVTCSNLSVHAEHKEASAVGGLGCVQ